VGSEIRDNVTSGDTFRAIVTPGLIASNKNNPVRVIIIGGFTSSKEFSQVALLLA
jgi:hypothetical protein